MMLRQTFLSISFLIVVFVAGRTSAQSLISIDDPIFGSDSITRDLNTGLEWLDLNLSTGNSYNDLVVLTQENQIFEDFTIASNDQVNELYFSANLTPGTTSDLELVTDFIDLVGQTSSQGVNPETSGITSSSSGFGLRQVSGLDFFFSNGAPEYIVGRGLSINEALTSRNRGGWLIRSVPVPEPSTTILSFLCLGSALLRRSRANSAHASG